MEDPGSGQGVTERWFRTAFAICLFGVMAVALILAIWVKFLRGPPMAFWYGFIVFAIVLVIVGSLWIARSPDLKPK